MISCSKSLEGSCFLYRTCASSCLNVWSISHALMTLSILYVKTNESFILTILTHFLNLYNEPWLRLIYGTIFFIMLTNLRASSWFITILCERPSCLILPFCLINGNSSSFLTLICSFYYRMHYFNYGYSFLLSVKGPSFGDLSHFIPPSTESIHSSSTPIQSLFERMMKLSLY